MFLRQTSEVYNPLTNRNSNFSVCIHSALVYTQEDIYKNFIEKQVVLQLRQPGRKINKQGLKVVPFWQV